MAGGDHLSHELHGVLHCGVECLWIAFVRQVNAHNQRPACLGGNIKDVVEIRSRRLDLTEFGLRFVPARDFLGVSAHTKYAVFHFI